jgi:hypothetical protein
MVVVNRLQGAAKRMRNNFLKLVVGSGCSGTVCSDMVMVVDDS